MRIDDIPALGLSAVDFYNDGTVKWTPPFRGELFRYGTANRYVDVRDMNGVLVADARMSRPLTDEEMTTFAILMEIQYENTKHAAPQSDD